MVDKALDACITRTECRAGGGALETLWTLGDFHLSGFVGANDPDPEKYPLELCWARESGLVQLRHTVQPDLMYRKYWYRSGTNESMVQHLEDIAGTIKMRYPVRPGDIVVDIGCNDGTLLKAFGKQMWRVGFDPSDIDPQPGSMDMHVRDYFSAARYERLPFPRREGNKARVVTSIAMLYDLDDPVAFAREVAQIMREDGIWVTEQHYLPEMLENGGFDAICHEHLTYFTLSSLEWVVAQAGLKVIDVERNRVNGGSFRAYIAKRGEPSVRVKALRAVEANIDIPARVREMAVQAQRNGNLIRRILRDAAFQGELALGYGASTKFNTLLQYYGISSELLPAIADRNPAKWGLYTAGTRIPIISEEAAREQNPDYFVVGPYHFLDGFMERERAWLDNGGKFMIPVGSLLTIGAENDL